jgi:hypothetical protein
MPTGIDIKDAVLRDEPLGREGMVTVYDSEGEYVGCMGVELWAALLNANEAWRAGHAEPVPDP